MEAEREKQLHNIQVIRFILPFVLFLIVALYETWEHIILKGSFYLDFHFTSEVAFFGIVGPTAVFAVLTYVVSLMKENFATASELEKLNWDLEQKVAERTEELAEQNEALAKANQELQKLDQLKSDFVSLVSHELRGPLTTLNGGIELALQEGDNMPPESRRILEIMSWESQRLTGFVQTILDVSRLDAGKISLNKGPVAISPMIQRAINLIFAGKDRQVLYNENTDLPPAWADEIYLEKIFCNLLSNAEKYTPQDSLVEVNAKLENGHLEVSVIDHGPGIPPESQSLVFERFSRLESGDQISSQGWGLGLHFSKSLAEVQGCDLVLVSPAHDTEDNPGTKFLLTIPLAADVPDDE